MRLKTLLVIAVLLFYTDFISAVLLGPIQYTGCANINSSGSFVLGSNLVGANITPAHKLTTACILISESNVELDCYGYTITNDVSGNTTGILLDSRNSSQLTNITVKNCRVSNYTWGVYVYETNQSLLMNNTANLTANIGFTVENSSYINLTDNIAYSNTDGFSSNYSSYNIWYNNTAYNNSIGFYSEFTDNLTSIHNTARNNTNGFTIFYGTGNSSFTSNTAYGNVQSGFSITTYGTSNNLFVNNTAYLNSLVGFLLTSASGGNTLINNTAYNNSGDGFTIIFLSSNNVLENNTAYANTQYGFSVQNSNTNNLTGNTAYENALGFLIYDSEFNNLLNNTAHNNTENGFVVQESNQNNLVGNTAYNQSSADYYHIDNGNGFYVYLSSENNLTDNVALNNAESGFMLYQSLMSNLTGNIASLNEWTGFYLYEETSSTLVNNTAYANNEYGFQVYLSTGNNITNNIAQENRYFDLYADPLFWDYLSPSLEDDVYCNNVIENITGSGGRPINYTNTTVNWSDFEASEIILCNADNSTLTNITISGSDTLQNNGLIITRTENAAIDSVTSSDNLIGFMALFSSNNNFTNSIANNNLFAGFGVILSIGNRFANNIASGSIEAGFITLLSNDSVYINNTAHGNYMAGFAIIEGSNNTSLTNNTAYNTSQFGTMVQNSDFTMITGDHYYANDVDFAVNTSVELAPLNLSGVIFDNPLGNYGNYTNISLNDVVQPNESYAITWSTKPASDPLTELSFYGKFINIRATPGAVIDNIIWHWTNDEAATRNEGSLKVYRHDGSIWQNSPGHSLLDVANNQLSISSISSFGVFGLYESSFIPQSGGGGGAGCTSNLKVSVEPKCPENNVVIRFTETGNNPVGEGTRVDLTSDFGSYVGYTNGDGEVSFTLPNNGQYSLSLSGIYCFEYHFNYEKCTEGCSSDEDCSDSQYCEGSTGLCKPVGCLCGQAYSHSCHPHACCADTDCNSSYTCVNHECKVSVIGQPECTTNGDCNNDQYCSNGKCFAIQLGKCGRIINHAWEDYECCNNSDCQKGSVCINNTCVLYRIITDPSGFLGAQHELLVLPEGSYQLDITTPKGVRKIITTDATGHATFVLENAGLYTVSLIKEEAAVNVTVTAISKEQPPSTPPVSSQPDLCIPGAIIGVILLLAIIYLAYRKISRS